MNVQDTYWVSKWDRVVGGKEELEWQKWLVVAEYKKIKGVNAQTPKKKK